MTDNKSTDKKVHFAPYCILTEIKSLTNMSKDEKNMLWYNRNEIYKFRKNIQFQKYSSDDFHLRIDLGYLFSKKRQKKRWCIMDFILEGQKTLTSDNLALLYAAITKKERESGIERAKLLNKIISTHGLSYASITKKDREGGIKRADLLNKIINIHDLSGFIPSSLSNPKENLYKSVKRPRSNSVNDHGVKLLKAF